MCLFQAEFYENVMTRLRAEPEYFRVAFYGRSFPKFLQNKVFVYRGRGYERLPEFQSRILDQFPMAELMTKLSPPSEAEMNQLGQLVQINKVETIMEIPARLSGQRCLCSGPEWHLLMVHFVLFCLLY